MLQLLLIGFGGVLAYCLVRLITLSKDARAANVKFNWYQDYVSNDIYSILLSFLTVVIWYYVYGEVAAKYSGLQNFMKASFFGMGLTGSWIVQLLLGKAKKQIRAIVDAKTTAFDGTEHSTTPLTTQAAKDISNGEV